MTQVTISVRLSPDSEFQKSIENRFVLHRNLNNILCKHIDRNLEFFKGKPITKQTVRDLVATNSCLAGIPMKSVKGTLRYFRKTLHRAKTVRLSSPDTPVVVPYEITDGDNPSVIMTPNEYYFAHLQKAITFETTEGYAYMDRQFPPDCPAPDFVTISRMGNGDYRAVFVFDRIESYPPAHWIEAVERMEDEEYAIEEGDVPF